MNRDQYSTKQQMLGAKPASVGAWPVSQSEIELERLRRDGDLPSSPACCGATAATVTLAKPQVAAARPV